MSKPVKTGKTLETLVTYIEKALANKEQVTVNTRKRLPDRTTGRLREHDVVLTLTQGHHEMVIAIECRDHSRPTQSIKSKAFRRSVKTRGWPSAS